MSFANIDLEAQKQPLLRKTHESNYAATDIGGNSSASSNKNHGSNNISGNNNNGNNNAVGGAAVGGAVGPNGNDNNDNPLDTIIHKTSIELQNLSQLISQFDNQRRQLGTKRDCVELRRNIETSTTNITELLRAIEALVIRLTTLVNSAHGSRDSNHNQERKEVGKVKVSSRQIMMKEKLTSEFLELEKKFANLKKLFDEKKKVFVIPQTHTVSENGRSGVGQGIEDESPNQLQIQMQVQENEDPELVEQTELQYHLLLTEERNREIEQVANGVMEVNSIFKDLNQLLDQQGEQINTVEDNILQLHGHTQQADRELHKAHEYQKKKGRWSCIFLVAICVFVLIVVLVVLS